LVEVLLQVSGSYFAIRIGEMYFGPVAASILISALALTILSARGLWRIGQSEDRQKRLLDALGRERRVMFRSHRERCG
jgi:hypothetical protein